MPQAARQTKQKAILEEEIKKFDSFFAAEELYEKAKKKDGKIGIATIYRFLKDLKRNNDIHSYLCERKAIYSISEKNHSHFSCQKCNKVVHLNIGPIDFLKKSIKGSMCHFQINIEGICENCNR